MNRRELIRSIPSIVGALAAIYVAACNHHEPHADGEKGKFLVTSPLRKDTEITREYVSQIRAIQHIELRAQERGYLQGIYVDEGQTVKRGQRMFQITPLLYQAELQKAAAESEFARLEFQNTKLLADSNVVSPSELALSHAKMSKAQAEWALAKVHRDLTRISAPFSGIMGRFQVRIGSLVDEGELLTTLSDNQTVWVYFNVTESEYLDYKSRPKSEVRSVKLMMANGKIFDQPGKVETIEADFNNETGNIAFRASFQNPDGLLRHGETGTVQMAIPLHDALVVPQKATFEILDKKYVFVVDEHNAVKQREISVAHELPHLYVVSKGLGAEERIMLDGLRKVRDGDEIEVEYQHPNEAYARLEISIQ